MNDEFRFEPDPDGIAEVSEHGPAVAAALTDAAERAASKMRSLSGGMDSEDFFGFRDSIKVIPAAEDTRRMAIGSQKGVAFVGSDSPGWHLQEFGTRRQRPRSIIRRALRMVPGVDFKEGVR